MKLKQIFLSSAVVFSAALVAQTPQQPMSQLISENFEFANQQFKYLIRDMPANKLPQSFDANTGKGDYRDITWWCSGFFPGSLWLVYSETQDPAIKQEAEKLLKIIEPNQYYTGNHDIGFMMFDSFGTAYEITKNPEYKEIIYQSAKSLSTRYNPTVKSIMSWNKSQRWTFPVIIDNMMNLELLEWVSQQTGNKEYSKIAEEHADTTLKNHFRPNYSSYHVVDYDPETGKVLQKKTWQGYSDDSEWTRGQAWGLYGYTMMYRFTHKKKYLKQAKNIAQYILNHPKLPADKIPYWDFSDPKIPNVPRDASAGAIMASALLELGQYTSGKEKQTYLDNAEQMLRSLASPAYRAKLGENGGFLLMHSTGAFPLNSEIDVPLVYADYYFLEGLKRYKEWYLK